MRKPPSLQHTNMFWFWRNISLHLHALQGWLHLVLNPVCMRCLFKCPLYSWLYFDIQPIALDMQQASTLRLLN
ncbi:hypothetical protein EYF80_039152 [Liparis tanakae]|uniref:Uncharacterized protein n=1 Tax=Liparis tanakae TaxID=230148 RepID=A0A4Z2GB94_9TELE|nr:hypothetical protein EYF80_039152 [Liparis tanakae]